MCTQYQQRGGSSSDTAADASNHERSAAPLSDIDRQLQSLETQIKDVESQIAEAKEKAETRGRFRTYWQKEKDRLVRKEEYLRTEKDRLA